MKSFCNFLLSTATVLSVSACSSGGTNSLGQPGISPEENARNFSQVNANDPDNVEDAGGAVANGKTLSARSVSVAGLATDYQTGKSSLANAAVTERRNASGELTVSVNGVETAFAEGDRYFEIDGRSYGYEIEGGTTYTGAYNQTGEIDDFLNPGDNYAEVLYVNTNGASGSPKRYLRAYAVLGTETRDDALSSLPTATYNGYTEISSVSKTSDEQGNFPFNRVQSDLKMTADFGAGEISGVMSNFAEQDELLGYVPFAGSVAMNKATITQNGFKGTLTADDAFGADGVTIDPTSTYSGAFYGPSAETVAGVLNVTGSNGIAGYNGIGYFIADRNRFAAE